MRLAVIAFTAAGGQLAIQLCEKLRESGHVISENALFCAYAGNPPPSEGISGWTKRVFDQNDGLLFIGACGIAVRAVAPFLRDKLTDPAVVSVDQQGNYAVALVSGHVGGATMLAQQVARITGGVPVISTATDLTGCFAVDVWATKQELAIGERELAKQVSAALLAGEPIGFVSDFSVAGEMPAGLYVDAPLGICVSLDSAKRPFEQTLHLLPRWLILGAGCRRGVSAALFEETILKRLSALQLSVRSIGWLATVDLKKDEPCMLAFCEKYHISFLTASAQELAKIAGEFTTSDFVRQTAGVDNVCERAVIWAGAEELCAKKLGENGITSAIGIKRRTLSFLD